MASSKSSGSLVNTVVISLAISVLSLCVAAVNFYWTALRPARVTATMTIVAETSRRGQRILIPTSISNGGAKAATVLNAKLIESEPATGRQSLWGAEFSTNIASALDVLNGTGKAADDVSLFVPFLVPPNQEVQSVLVFVPTATPGFSDALLARGGKTLGYTMILSTTAGDVTVTKSVAWPGITDGALDKHAFGVAGATEDAEKWFDDTTPLPTK
jgi:hypothetical protein